jgi:exodeoxyribonuclease-3
MTRCFARRCARPFAGSPVRAGPTRFALHPNKRIYTFWKYFRNAFARDAGLRIDHLLLSRPVADRLAGAGVDRAVRGRELASDHAPAWIEIGDTKSGPPRRGRRVAAAKPR